MYIIPAIDILNGKVVRLREGDYEQATFYDVTLNEMIEKYQSNGTEFIHIIDLNGAKGDFSNQKFLFDIIHKTEIKDQVVVAIDVLDEVIKYSGWMESSPIKLKDYVDKCLSLGFFRFLCTDIDKDGKLGGAGVDVYKKLLEHSPFIKLIASGGISSMQDIEELQNIKV